MIKDPFEPGKRVHSDLLGEGTVQETPLAIRNIGLIKVLWDKDPPVQYNMGYNPATEFAYYLTVTD